MNLNTDDSIKNGSYDTYLTHKDFNLPIKKTITKNKNYIICSDKDFKEEE
jgi:hypothetical protein